MHRRRNTRQPARLFSIRSNALYMTKWHAVCRSCGRVIRSFSAKEREKEVIFQ